MKKKKESSYLKYWDINNLYGWAMSLKLPLGNFKWVEEIYQFNNDFIKNYNKNSDTRYFLKVGIHYPEEFRKIHNDLPFLHKIMKIEKVEKLLA